MSRTPEGKVKEAVKKLLEASHVYFFSPATAGYGTSGAFDIVACVKGRFVGIECKADASKKPTALQQRHAAEVTSSGGIALLIHGANIDVLRFTLNALSDDEEKA